MIDLVKQFFGFDVFWVDVEGNLKMVFGIDIVFLGQINLAEGKVGMVVVGFKFGGLQVEIDGLVCEGGSF